MNFNMNYYECPQSTKIHTSSFWKSVAFCHSGHRPGIQCAQFRCYKWMFTGFRVYARNDKMPQTF